MVIHTAFTGMRWGEVTGLDRANLNCTNDIVGCTAQVRRANSAMPSPKRIDA